MAFTRYQAEQRERMVKLMDLSNMVAKIHTYHNPFYKFMANWVLPYQADRSFADQVAEYIATAAKFDFLDAKNFVQGRVAWKERRPADQKEEERVDERLGEKVQAVAVAA